MNRQITKRPTLAELWRNLLVFLEDQGVEDAPAQARKLAVDAWTGWDSVTEPRRSPRIQRPVCGVV